MTNSRLAPNWRGIPDSLRNLDSRHVLWRYDIRDDGKPAKVPYQITGHRARSDDPSTWSSFMAAAGEYQRVPDKWAGVGVMLHGGPLAGIDLDHCRDAATGAIEGWAQAIVDQVGSYTEVSPSGEGLRIFVFGAIPDGRRRKAGVEMYGPQDKRYLTITGHRLTNVDVAQRDLTQLHAELFPPDPPASIPDQVSHGNGHVAINLDDQDLLQRAFAAANGATIADLYSGHVNGHASWSEAVPALLCRLAFWTRDPAQIDRLFRASGLMKEKWDRPQNGRTWGAIEVDRALGNVTETYSGPAATYRHNGHSLNGNGHHPAQTSSMALRGNFVDLAGVTPTEVQWLWKGRIPLGKISIQDGDPGQGKSMILLDIAARVSRGAEMPDGSPGIRGNVLLFMSEDDYADTIVPRLLAAEADCRQIGSLPDLGIPEDLPALEEFITKNAIRLILFDPLIAYLGKGVNPISDKEVRQALIPMAEMAQRTGVAIVGNRHLNKAGGSGATAMYRGGASIAFTAVSRSSWLIGSMPEEEDIHYMAPVKQNLTRRPPSLKYQIAETAEGIPHIEWLGESAVTANQLVGANGSASGEDASAIEEATEFLVDLLGDGGIVPADGVKRQAEGRGLAWSTVRQAKQFAKVESVKESMTGGWIWRIKRLAPDE